jgi:hypothetical protein
LGAVDEMGLAVYIQWHEVAGDKYHSLLKIVPDDQKTYTTISMKNSSGNFFTLGAGPECCLTGNVIKGRNRETDVNNAKAGQALIKFPNKGKDKDVISNILAKYNNFKNNVEYEVFPDVGEKEYNSNGFINGLLLASGYTIARPDSRLSGWTQPIPKGYF